MKPVISMILMSRGNPKALKKFYENVYTTASNPEQIEVVVCLDDDDKTSHNIKFHTKGGELKIKGLIFPKGTKAGEYIQRAYDRASGRLLMLTATDVVIQTQGWDNRIIKEFEKWPDEIGLVYPNDLIFGESLATAGATVSKRACVILGYLYHPAYNWFRADDHLHHIYDMLSEISGEERISYLDDVIFEHLSYKIVDSKRVYDKAGCDDKGATQIYVDLNSDRKIEALLLAMYCNFSESKFCDYVKAIKNIPGPFPNYLNLKLFDDKTCIGINGKNYPLKTYRGIGISPEAA
jgi:hypothetical protein